MANGYKIDFTTNTVIMNCTFAKKANEYGTDEYNTLKNIRADYPQIGFVVKKGREQKKANQNKRLTYNNMKSYIASFEGAEEMLKVFDGVVALSVAQKSPYKYVSDWFKKQYPKYREMPEYKEGQLSAGGHEVVKRKVVDYKKSEMAS